MPGPSPDASSAGPRGRFFGCKRPSRRSRSSGTSAIARKIRTISAAEITAGMTVRANGALPWKSPVRSPIPLTISAIM